MRAQIPMDGENAAFIETLSEAVHLYTDRDIYLSGEDVWFTVFVAVNNTTSNLSEIIYLELFDVTDRKLFTGKFEVINGCAAGNFQIPAETTTGNYFIRAYTQYQRNFSPGNFSIKTITIINPEYPLPGKEKNEDGLEADNEANDQSTEQSIGGSNNDIEILIQPDKSVYSKRQAVELNVKLPNAQAEDIIGLCISVARRGTLVQTTEPLASGMKKNEGSNNTTGNIFWIPETRGVSISGFVNDKKSEKPLAGINIYLSVLGSDPQFHITQTKANGAFIFSLGYLKGGHEIFIGVKQEDHEEIQLLVNNDFSNDFAPMQNIPLAIDSTYETLLEEMLVNHQSQTIFSREVNTNPDTTVVGFDIFGKADVSVYLSDYIDLADLETVFFELVRTTSIKSIDGRKTLSVLNPETFRVSSNQLFLLDHVPVFNFEALLSIPPAKVKNIDVINRTHYLGDNTLKSVVMMNTYDGDFAGYVFPEGSIFVEYQTITLQRIFVAPEYLSQSEKESRMPDFRTTLYWNPEISISNNDTTLRFFTSDNTGVYDVFVRGITERGEVCIGKATIEIE